MSEFSTTALAVARSFLCRNIPNIVKPSAYPIATTSDLSLRIERGGLIAQEGSASFTVEIPDPNTLIMPANMSLRLQHFTMGRLGFSPDSRGLVDTVGEVVMALGTPSIRSFELGYK